MLEESDVYWRQAITKYTPPRLDDGKHGAARDLLTRAQAELWDVALEAQAAAADSTTAVGCDCGIPAACGR
jgi:hypothetical protein